MTPRRKNLFACILLAALAGLASPPAPAGEGPPAAAPAPPVATGAQVLGFDPDHTRFGFELRTRWGQRVRGHFPVYGGGVVRRADGTYQVHIRLATGAVEVDGPERYTAMARGEDFFDADRHPVIEFLSEPQPEALAHDGGSLRGRLSMHGVRRTESFTLRPATCARPARDCDTVVTGRIDRTRYGLERWRAALGDSVRFDLRVRLLDPAQ